MAAPKQTIKVYGRLTPPTTLLETDYLAGGGEGNVYVKNGLVYKIYLDPHKVIPEKKIEELAPLSHPAIIKPDDILMDTSGLPIGYTMKFVQDTVALPRLFTTDFQSHNGIKPETIVELVEEIMKTVEFIHSHHVLIVDMNEFNFLVNGSTYKDPYFIDVDSWQTPSFRATAIMDSIKDWQANVYSNGTDWFSFGILACQLFIGIHPFRGKHNTVKTLQERVKSNISIFNKAVDLPPSVRDFNLIPPAMMAWFEDVFERGKRIAPPMVMGKAIFKAQVTVLQGTDRLLISVVGDFGATITGAFWVNGTRIVFTPGTVYIDRHPHALKSKHTGVIQHNGRFYLVDSTDHKLSITDAWTGDDLVKLPIMAKKVLITDNRIYVISTDKVSEVILTDLSDTTHVGIKTSWDIMPSSYTVYRGFVLSDVLGLPHVLIPFRSGACALLPIPELKGYKILDAKYENRALIVVGFKAGVYDELYFLFDEGFSKYYISSTSDITMAAVNFVSLPNGKVISLTGDDNLELTNLTPGSKTVLPRVGLEKNATLCHDGLSVLFYSDTKLYNVKTK